MIQILKIFKTSSYSRQLKTQLLASFLFITLIIMSLGFFLTYVFVTDIFKNKNEEYTLKMFRKDEININSLFDEVNQIFKLIIINNDYQLILKGNFNSKTDEEEAKIKVFNTFLNITSSHDYIASIYNYGDNGVILGASSKYSDYLVDTTKTSKFFNSSLYLKTTKKGFTTFWPGVFMPNYFDVVEGRAFDLKNKILPSLRKIKLLDNNSGNGEATIIINVYEKKLRSMFLDEGVEPTSIKYIVDDTGIIISHKDESVLGSSSEAFKSINKKNSYGSTIIRDKTGTKQVIYYKLKNKGWMMIDEIPIAIVLKDSNIIRNIMLIVFFSCLAAVFTLSLYWIYRLTRPLNALRKVMNQMENGQLGIILEDLPKNELGKLGSQFNIMSKSIKDLVKRNAEIENEKRELAVETLQMQINPHFIFNTLNVIKWMAIIANNLNVEEGIETLGNLLKPVFKDKSPTWTLGEEIFYVENYLKIINLRFGEKIKVEYTMPIALYKYKVIKFMLQPLVENSFTHGFDENRKTIKIVISARESGNDIHVIIKDDGAGIIQNKLDELRQELEKSVIQAERTTGVGVSNIHRRIRLNFGEPYGISILSDFGFGTEIIMSIPKTEDL